MATIAREEAMGHAVLMEQVEFFNAQDRSLEPAVFNIYRHRDAVRRDAVGCDRDAVRLYPCGSGCLRLSRLGSRLIRNVT